MGKDLRCRLNLHHYVKRYNGEADSPMHSYYECSRCRKFRDIPFRGPGSYLGM